MKKIYTLLLFFILIIRMQAQPPVSLINVVNNSCMDVMDGSATFSINGTSFPYSATLTGCGTVTLGGITTNTFTMNGIGNCLPSYVSLFPNETYNLALYDNLNNAAGFLTFTITSTNPYFLLQASTYNNISCPGLNNGSTSWVSVYGTPPFTYLWSTSTNANYSTSQSISNVSPGIYNITATDANGCKQSWNTTFSEPYFSNTVNDATAPTCCNGAIGPYIVGIFPSSVNYSFTPSISNLSSVCAGNYTLTANSPSCTMSTTLSVGCLTGINELQKGSIKIYPNPAISYLEIDVPEGYDAEEVIVTNQLGQEILHSAFKNPVDISTLARGSYFLTLKFQSSINYHSKFIKE